MNKERNNAMQKLCRSYLSKTRHMARKHGLGLWLNNIIKANARNECVATEKEVEMLARLCDDYRINRHEIHGLLGKSYRDAVEQDDFARIKKLKRVGIYSKVSALLYKATQRNKKKKNGK